MSIPRSAALLGIVAVASLAFNLFLGGTLLGQRFHKPPPGQDLTVRLETMWRSMPEQDQAVAHDIVSRHQDELLIKWRAWRSASKQASLSLTTTPFDANDIQAEFTKSNDRAQDFRHALQDLLTEIAGKVSPEGRTRLRFGPPP